MISRAASARLTGFVSYRHQFGEAMRTVAIFNIAKENVNYTGLLTSLKFEVVNLNSFEDLFQLNGLDLLICDGKFFVTLDKQKKAVLRQKYTDLKIVLSGEFSDSYLFSKAQEEQIDDFIVVPFGYKECLNLLERLNFSYSQEVLNQESFEE